MYLGILADNFTIVKSVPRVVNEEIDQLQRTCQSFGHNSVIYFDS